VIAIEGRRRPLAAASVDGLAGRVLSGVIARFVGGKVLERQEDVVVGDVLGESIAEARNPPGEVVDARGIAAAVGGHVAIRELPEGKPLICRAGGRLRARGGR
jgi:hypothetical protein